MSAVSRALAATRKPFDLTTAIALRSSGTSLTAIAEHLSAGAASVSASTVRRRLMDAGALRPDPGAAPARCVIRVRGLLHDGWGFAACRRTNQTFRDGQWRATKGRNKTVAVCWPACPQTTTLTSAAVGALLALLHLPPGTMARIEAREDVLNLLRHHRDTPQTSPLPPYPAAVLEPLLEALRQADLADDTTSPDWDIPAGDTDQLTPEWASQRRASILGTAHHPLHRHPTQEHQEPQPGSWITDFGYRWPEGGVAAFYRYTHLPLALTPVIVIPLAAADSVDGEAMAALLAHAWARMTGEDHPVIHSDCQGIGRRIQRAVEDARIKRSSSLKTLLTRLPAEEIRKLDLRWTGREHKTIAHADKTARAHMTPADTTTALLRRSAHMDYGNVITAITNFFEKVPPALRVPAQTGAADQHPVPASATAS